MTIDSELPVINHKDPNEAIEQVKSNGMMPLGGGMINPADIEPGKQFHKKTPPLKEPPPQTQPTAEIAPS